MGVTRLFRTALRYAVASVGDLARESGYSRIAFDRYLNRRAPSKTAALALAKALERRAARLADLAARLREACREPPRGGQNRPRGGRLRR